MVEHKHSTRCCSSTKAPTAKLTLAIVAENSSCCCVAVPLCPVAFATKRAGTTEEIEAYFRSECKLASEGKRTSAVAAAFASKDSSEINGLKEWLREVGYEHSFQKVADWCHDNGAVLLEEVQENWEQVISDLGLEQGSCAGAHNEQAFQVAGLSAWLEEIELEDYLEDVLVP